MEIAFVILRVLRGLCACRLLITKLTGYPDAFDFDLDLDFDFGKRALGKRNQQAQVQ